MATKRSAKTEPPAPERSEAEARLMPTWTAGRLAINTRGEDAASKQADALLGRSSIARTVWLGAPEVLDPLGLTSGAEVTPDDLTRATRGRHVETEEKVRKVTSIVPDVVPGQARAPGRSDRFEGVVQLRGTHVAPEAVNERWRAAGAAEQDVIESELIDRTGTGIGVVTNSDKYAAAAVLAVVGSGKKAGLEVSWLAVAADRGDGVIASPYDRLKVNAATIEAAERKTAVSATEVEVEAKQEAPTKEPPPPEQAPRGQATPEQTPAPPAQAPPERPAAPPSVEVPMAQGPLRDSLTRHRGALGDDLVAEIAVEARELRVSLGLPDLPEQNVRDLLPQQSPFEPLGHRPGQQPNVDRLNNWGAALGKDAVLAVAVEEELISRAQARHVASAEREAARRGQPNANPVALVREARGEMSAEKVARRATILASHLPGHSDHELATKTREAREEIRESGGLAAARFETVAQATALQFNRNQMREQELARESAAAEMGREQPGAEKGAEQEAAGIGM